MPNPTLAALADDLDAGRTSARKLVEDCIARIADPAGEGQRTFIHVDREAALERLGIGAEMKSKTTAFTKRSERFEAVARGDIEIGFNQISEIVAATGVDLVGPLPADIQHYTLFSAAIVANSKNKEAARSLLQFISSPNARAIMKAKGFEAP